MEGKENQKGFESELGVKYTYIILPLAVGHEKAVIYFLVY